MGNLLKSKEVASKERNASWEYASLMCTPNEVNDGEGEDADDEDYDYNLWHDFVGLNCEWDDDKDEDGGRGSSTNKQRIANPPSTFDDYVDEVEFRTPNNLSSQHSTIPLHHTHQYHRMTDPYYKEMKHHKREYDWVSNCVYANYKIPTKSICGGAITVEADDRGRNYYVCKDFKNNGLHIRHDCLTALEEELDCLRSQYAEEVSLRRELQFELAQMREEIKELKQLIMVDR
ncbi:hypothetical protein Bca52824_081201 [Brassica carinata]|uniref:Uncharacterized protein n=1 Tax=Brassica carinata TaxID=52824 RepID=A0A8X7PGY3_BRACI|nr:hypothetical protein Bca52824_081201 [Brassica carinata]